MEITEYLDEENQKWPVASWNAEGVCIHGQPMWGKCSECRRIDQDEAEKLIKR